MSEPLLYQVRITIADEFAEMARNDQANDKLKPLTGILEKHHTLLGCQYDAFANYCAEAEKNGVEHYPLYKWTKVTIDDPEKKAKYTKAFTLYVNGDEVYAKDLADALEADLQPLVGGPIITKMAKHDTNPANNPQAPAHLQG